MSLLARYVLVASLAEAFIPVPFQTQRFYGFDGSWQACQVQVGGFVNGTPTPMQWTTVDLLPGGSWENFVMTPGYCQTQGFSDSCGVVTGWDPGSQQTQSGQRIFYRPTLNDSNYSGVFLSGYIYAQNLNIGWNAMEFTSPNTTSVAVDQGSVTLPDGSAHPNEVGFLALGADQQQQAFTTSSTNASSSPILTWTAPGYFYNQSRIASYSYGLHLGAAGSGWNMTGSLIFGGYDKGRAIGPGTTFGDHPPQLLDIVVGVETGGSPFPFTSRTGFLRDASGTQTSVQASIDPVTPYLHLSRQTCDALAQVLPINFDAQSGYYLWNQNDPAYHAIVSSPAYLGFVFPPAPGNTAQVTIKVPLLLLNLTLTQPALQSGSAPYFPCRPYSSGPVFALGRAFLQAAFVGRNWNQHVSWLAQAPGPGSSHQGLGNAPQDIQDSQTTLEYFSDDSLFNASWSGFWTPLPSNTTSPPIATSTGTIGSGTGNSTTSSRLSENAEIGIGVGIGIGGLVVGVTLGICVWLWRKRSPGNEIPAQPVDYPTSSAPSRDTSTLQASVASYFAKMEPTPAASPAKLRAPIELPVRQDPYELDADGHRGASPQSEVRSGV